MARIRTIKPEFPQSESIGRVSREARLLFVLLWTVCDDSGRTRAASRMLASLLYPYDDDAPKHIEGWLGELEREGCIVRYAVDGTTYLQVCNWLKHQKIDKPSASKIPEFDEASRILANPREASTTDLGSRILDLGSRTGDLTTAAPQPKAGEPDWFKDIRALYPKRGGSQPWPRALKAAVARIREGESHQNMIDGVLRYADFVRATGKEGTEYVLQAATFFGPDKHYLEPWTLPATKADARYTANIETARKWAEG